ncbi:SMI1/KNR4 family protein, partial [Streptomyces sp. SID10116]|nr:SMI1/KNR4 family protein [Streptomyces sp. SID10116]
MSVAGVILGHMEHAHRIAAFTELVGPPADAAPAVDWASVEAWLEVPLPGDYKSLVTAYGPAEIGRPGTVSLRLHTPCVSADGRYAYGAWVVETHRHSAIRPGMFTQERRRFLPDEGGLLAFATTSAGDHLFWDTSVSKDPDAWPVVLLTTSVAVGGAAPWAAYEMPLLEFLHTAVHDGVPHPGEPGGLLGPLAPEARTWPPL